MYQDSNYKNRNLFLKYNKQGRVDLLKLKYSQEKFLNH